MAKKYVVQNAQVLEVISIHGCHAAKGGRKAPEETARVMDGEKAGKFRPGQEAVTLTGRYNEKNYQATIKRRRAQVQELIVNNFTPYHAAMMTLTFGTERQASVPEEASLDDGDELSCFYQLLGAGEGAQLPETVQAAVKVYDPATEKQKQLPYCNTLFKKFIQRMKYRYDGFKYVAVVAKQDNGRCHYHLICNLNYIPFQELYNCWGHGAVYFHSFRQSGGAGFWAAIHYMQKNMTAEAENMKVEKGYLASKGLQRSKVFRSWIVSEQEAVSQIEQSLRERKPLYQYQTKHTYEATGTDGIFVQDVNAVYKYHAYRQDNSAMFPKLPLAKKRSRI